MKKKVVIISCIAILISFIIYGIREDDHDSMVCRCILSPTSSPHDTYLIEISTSGVIRTSFGLIPDTIVKMACKDEKINPIHTPLIEQVEQKKEKKLSDKDYESIVKKIKNLNVPEFDNPFVEGWFWEGWMVILQLGNKQYIYEKHYRPNKEINAITNELIRLSPIAVSFDKMIGGRVKILPDSLDSHAQRTEPQSREQVLK